MEVEEEALPPNKGSKTAGLEGNKNSKVGSKGAKGLPASETESTMSNQTGKRRSLAVEEKYQKMTQREHIIKRPDTYSMSYYDFVTLSWFC